MRWDGPVIAQLLIPTVVCGLAGGGGVYGLTGSLPAAVGALAGSLVGGAGMVGLIGRMAGAAEARLRHRERRESTSGRRRVGVYGPLLQEALDALEHFEEQAREARRCKTERDARSHVRRQRIRQLEAALNGLEQPVLITDGREAITFANPAAQGLFAADSDDGVGEGLRLESQPDLHRLIAETRGRSAAKDSRTGEFDLSLDGRPVPHRAVARNIFNADRSLLGVATVVDDISDERHEKARHAEFISSVCHELKTPISGIKAFVEMLLEGDVTDADERRELYGFIDAQLDRLTRLVHNLLNLARIESGVLKVQRDDCELNDLLRKGLGVVQPAAEEKQIRLISELSELYVAVHVDPDLLGQAVINLLSNAIKYTPEGGEVRLKSRMEDGRALIEVRDTGLGIPEEALPHIFDRFYRVPENNRAAAGTGLGLALVKYIVTELHNGEVRVDSTVEVGTCFTVVLPMGHRMRQGQPGTLCATGP